MKKLLPLVCVVLLLGADKKSDATKDTEKLHGKWVAKSAERGGKAVDLDQDEHIPQSITFKGDKVTVVTRKGEHGVEELERRRQTYLEVTRSHPDVVVINAAQPAHAVLAEAQTAVCASVCRRWRTEQ